MKKIFSIAIIITTAFCIRVSAQFVATMEVKEPIDGICNDKAVYAIFSMLKGQVEAACPLSKAEIVKQLNEIQFLKANPKVKDKGMVNIIVNCKGEVVKTQIDNKSKSEELDKQVLAVFSSINKQWKPAKLDGKDVDSSILYSYTIKKGKIEIE